MIMSRRVYNYPEAPRHYVDASLRSRHDEQQNHQELRLPPLSSLLSGPRSPPSPRIEKPSLYSPSAATPQASRHERPVLSSRHGSLSAMHNSPREAESSSFSTLTSSRNKAEIRHDSHHPHSFSRRVHSTSDLGISSSSHLVSLPPLTSLSIMPPRSTSPSHAPSLSGAEFYPPRLPSTSTGLSPHSTSASSERGLDSTSASKEGSASIGPSRRRWTGGSSYPSPYERPRAIPADQDSFDHVWDIYSYTCRLNDEASRNVRRSYPMIVRGDIKALVYYLERELDQLERRDPHLTLQLAREASVTDRHQQGTSSHPLLRSLARNRVGAELDHPGLRQRSRQRSEHGDEEVEMRSDTVSLSSSVTASPPTSGFTRSLSGSRPNVGSIVHPHSSSLPAYQRSPNYQQHQQPSLSLVDDASASANAPLPLPKRVRKRKDEADQSCLSCFAKETPEWRKGPTGPRTLCNACGLLFAKQCRKREMDAQARGERPRGARPLATESLSPQEQQRSLIELRMAVNARSNPSPPA